MLGFLLICKQVFHIKISFRSHCLTSRHHNFSYFVIHFGISSKRSNPPFAFSIYCLSTYRPGKHSAEMFCMSTFLFLSATLVLLNLGILFLKIHYNVFSKLLEKLKGMKKNYFILNVTKNMIVLFYIDFLITINNDILLF